MLTTLIRSLGLIAMLASLFAVAGCDDEVEEGADNVGEGIENATEETGEALEEGADEVDQAFE